MEEKASAPMLRIPASLMPSYNSVMGTEEGKQASKRVKVFCGVCEKIRYYSIHRGVTRIGGIIACEACRHFYQKFKRQPCILTCVEGGTCLALNDNSRNRCRACWIGHILSRCPVPPELYQNLISHLPIVIQERMPSESPIAENIPEDMKGSLGLEVLRKNGEWEDVTVVSQSSLEESLEASNDSSTEASLGHNPDHFSGDSNPSHANDGDGNYVEGKWWIQNGSEGGYTLPGSGNNQTYFNMANMNSSGGLTSLTAMQSADGFQPLMPLTPVQYSQDQQEQSNGFHDLMSLNNIKQESEVDCQDGESQEARVFQKITVKQEVYIHPTQTDVQAPIYASQYFDHTEPEKPAPLDIKFVTRDHETYNGLNGWNIKEEEEESVSLESTPQATPQKKMKKPETKLENSDTNSSEVVNPESTSTTPPSTEKHKKRDRFNGIPLEEVAKKFLPDHLAHNLNILIIGINPGLYAAHVGHHYAGPGNHFWKCMYLSGLIPEPFNAYDDQRMLEYGIGFTNVVARTTRSSTDLSKKEMQEGSRILKSKIQDYKPRIAVFNGKTIYEIFSGKKNFNFGWQPEKVEGTDTHIWVMPSSSARCAQLPRALDKVPFYSALRKLLDYLTGQIQELDQSEIIFNVKLTNVKKVKPESDKETNASGTVGDSPGKGKQSPQKRKSEQTATPKKK